MPTAAAVNLISGIPQRPRVVEIPRALWWPILNGIILNTRPKNRGKIRPDLDQGRFPLLVHTQRQTKLLRGYLANRSTRCRQSNTPLLRQILRLHRRWKTQAANCGAS